MAWNVQILQKYNFITFYNVTFFLVQRKRFDGVLYLRLLQFNLKILLIYSCDFHQPALLVQRDLTRSSVGIVGRSNCFKRSTPCLPFALAALILRHFLVPIACQKIIYPSKTEGNTERIKHLSNCLDVLLKCDTINTIKVGKTAESFQPKY